MLTSENKSPVGNGRSNKGHRDEKAEKRNKQEAMRNN